MTNKIIEVRDLTKSYGDFQAVKGISFDVFEGEIFGLLGPNGAGKSTTLEIIETLRPKTGGHAGRPLSRNCCATAAYIAMPCAIASSSSIMRFEWHGAA